MYKDERFDVVEVPVKVLELEPWQKILIEAAGKIRTCGWVQERYGNKKDGYCAVGAIRQSHGTREDRITAKRILSNQIGHQHIPSWNDCRARTKEEVIAALEAAAK